MLILGNVFSLIASLFMVSIGLIKDKRRILLAQCSQFAFASIGNLLLGAFSGTVSNLFSIIRNLVFIKVKATVPLKIGFIALQCLFTALNGGFTLLDLCPILATVIFIWAIDTDKAVNLKIAIIAAQILWMIYDLCFRNYTAFSFDILTILSNLVGIAVILRNVEKNPKAQE